MLRIPPAGRMFEYENNFYLSASASRMGKWIAHYELYKLSADLPGDIVECGVFKGLSFIRLAFFREFVGRKGKKLIGFDTFSAFPEAVYPGDKTVLNTFIREAGSESISTGELSRVLKRAGVSRGTELVNGNITQTIPKYVKKHPSFKISLLNLDTDLYEPAKVILKHLYPRLVSGGVLLCDDYRVFPGETKAVDEYFGKSGLRPRRFFPDQKTPSFLIKP